MHQAFW